VPADVIDGVEGDGHRSKALVCSLVSRSRGRGRRELDLTRIS